MGSKRERLVIALKFHSNSRCSWKLCRKLVGIVKMLMEKLCSKQFFYHISSFYVTQINREYNGIRSAGKIMTYLRLKRADVIIFILLKFQRQIKFLCKSVTLGLRTKEASSQSHLLHFRVKFYSLPHPILKLSHETKQSLAILSLFHPWGCG